jgi:ribonuclease HI
VLAAGAGNISYAASALHAEAIAVYTGILYASQLGMTRVIVETDSTVLASSLKATEVDRSTIGAMVQQIRDCMQNDFTSCDVSICNTCNKVADCLAAFGGSVLASGSDCLSSQVPEFVNDLVSGDLPRCHI